MSLITRLVARVHSTLDRFVRRSPDVAIQLTTDQLTAYVREIQVQSEAALFALSELHRVLGQAWSRGSPHTCAPEFFYVHAFLGHSANLSKLLFPDRRTSKSAFARQRAKELRKIFRIARRSCLRSRGIRNSFEHFDAHLDKYFQSDHRGLLADMNVMPKGAIKLRGGVHGPGWFRNLDPHTLDLSFQGVKVNLAKLGDEIRRLRDSAQQ
jgi:hypothetical protein